MTNILIRSDKNSVTTLSLNDLPANSLSMPMMGEIQNQLTTIDHDDSIRVIIIKSESDKIFSSISKTTLPDEKLINLENTLPHQL